MMTRGGSSESAAAPELLRIRCTSWEEFSTFFERYPDGSQVFVPSIAPLPAQSSVELRLCSPDGNDVAIGARVVTTIPPGTDRPGIVLELDGLRDTELVRARELIRRSIAPERVRPVRVKARAVSSKPPQDPQLVLERLRKHWRAAEAMDDVELLGVEATSDIETIKRAYRMQSGRYHPHHFAKYGDDEITRLATQLFVRIQTAHLRLTDPTCARGAASDRNRASLRGTGGVSEIVVSDARRALEMFQFDAAEDLFEKALELPGSDTQRIERFLLLTRARRAKHRGDLQSALRGFRELLLLDPTDAAARVEVETLSVKLAPKGLGRVLKWGRSDESNDRD